MLPSQVGNCTVMDALFSIGIVHKNPQNFIFLGHQKKQLIQFLQDTQNYLTPNIPQ